MIRVLELIAKGFNLDDELDSLPKLYSSDEIKIDTTEEMKFKIIDELKKELHNTKNGLPKIVDVIDIDGVRIKFENGWGLVRASNTTPVLVARFEAGSLETKELLEQKVLSLVQKLKAKI